MTMKKLDAVLRVMAALLVLILCLLCAAFASDDAASGTDAVVETSAPVVYEYDIIIEPPSGWFTDSAEAAITIRDLNSTGWDNAVFIRGEENSGISLTGERNMISLSENGTYTVRVTDPGGGVHVESLDIECFDKTAPAVTAGIRDYVLHCEASDSQSGVYGIQVDGKLYTTLQNGALDLRLRDYTAAGKTLSVVAIDNVGNRSPQTVIDNPYYSDATPAPEGTNPPVIIYTGSQTQPTPAQSAPARTQTATQNSYTQPVSAGTAAVQPTPASTPSPTPVPTPEPTPEPEEITIEPGTGFSENGNAVTRDLLYDKHSNKQFITVQTRNGNIMYLVIDYDKVSDEDEEQYQTYFLNPVDEADLLALLDDDAISALTGPTEAPAETPAVCTCGDKCTVGHIDTGCPVCRTDMSKCTGKEIVTPTPAPTETPEEPETKKTGGAGGVLAVFLILGAIGGGAFYFLKFRKDRPDVKGDTDVTDEDYDDDDDEYPEENEEESSYGSQRGS